MYIVYSPDGLIIHKYIYTYLNIYYALILTIITFIYNYVSLHSLQIFASNSSFLFNKNPVIIMRIILYIYR